MSFQAMTWATAQPLKAIDKLVLIMLANYANHLTGQCNPSHDRLAGECGLSRSTLKASIGRLEESGLLTIERRAADGVALPNQYHLAIPDADPRGWAGSRPTPPGAGRGVGREPTTNLEPQPVSNRGAREDFSSWPEKPSAGHFAGWLELRRQKRAPVTAVVMESMGRELHQAKAIGWTVDEVLEECCTRGWQGFRVGWLEARNGKPQPARAGASSTATSHGSPNYAQGTRGGNSGRPASAIDRVLGNAAARAQASAAERGTRPDRGDDDIGLRGSLDGDARR